MSRQFFIIVALVLVACVSAFHSPVQVGRLASRAVSPLKMSTADIAVQASSSVLTQFSQALAFETDFGGYAGPAASLIFIGILILTLSPPLAPKE